MCYQEVLKKYLHQRIILLQLWLILILYQIQNLININIYNFRKVINLYISCTLNTCSRDLDAYLRSNNCLFVCVRLTKNANPDKYKYGSYGIGFDSRSELSLIDGSVVKNHIIFRADMSSSVYINTKDKGILILG